MNYDNPQFVAAVKKIISSLLKPFRDELEKQEHSNERNEETKDQWQCPQTMRATLYVQPSDRYKQETKDARKSVIAYWKAYAEILGIFILAAYTIVTALQWIELKKATKASADAATTAACALEENKKQFIETLGQMTKQTSAMERSNTINREALESVQQAYLSLKTPFQWKRVVPDPDHPENHVWAWTIYFENQGATRARNVAGIAKIAEVVQDEPSEYQFKGQYTSFPITRVGPKSSQGVKVEPILPEPFIFGIDLGAKPAPDIATKTHFNRRLFIWSWVYYRDIFPRTKPHITELCVHITNPIFILESSDEKQPTEKPPIDFSYDACSHHNCDDEECEDYKQIVSMVEKH